MARINKTIQDYQEQLKNKGIKNIPDFVQSILNADITNGKYSRFLLDCYLNDKFREEDLEGGLNSTVGIAVSLFHKHKNKLPEEMRSVYKYGSPGDLWSAVKQFDGELSGKEIKKELRDKIYGETKFVYEDDTGFKIISPLSEDSAKWWGRGTRWCTAADNDNMFHRYAEKSPLLIVLVPGSASVNTIKASITDNDDKKLQFWKYKKDIQFMDEADNVVEREYIEENWDVLKPICMWLKDLRFIPEKLIDYDMYLEAVKRDGHALQHGPEEHRDYNLCLEAVKQNGFAISFVPQELRDYNLCLEAVKQNGKSLYFIPEEFKDYNMCLEAVKRNGHALQYIPEEHRDYNLCLEAVKQHGHTLHRVPKELRDYNLCLEAVKHYGQALEHTPEEHKDYNLCLESVKQNGFALSDVPQELRDYNMCLEVVKQNGHTLHLVPDKFKDYNLCLESEKQKKEASQYIPEKHKNELQEYLHNKFHPLSENEYEQIFTEIRSIFPEKELSLKL